MTSAKVSEWEAKVAQLEKDCLDTDDPVEEVPLRRRIVELRRAVNKKEPTPEREEAHAQAKEALAEAKNALAGTNKAFAEAREAHVRAETARLRADMERAQTVLADPRATAEAKADARKAEWMALWQIEDLAPLEPLTRAKCFALCDKIAAETDFELWSEHNPEAEARLLGRLYKPSEDKFFSVARSGECFDLRLMDLTRDDGTQPAAVARALESDSLFLLGPSGCGKTATLFQMARQGEWLTLIDFKGLNTAQNKPPEEKESADFNTASLHTHLRWPQPEKEATIRCTVDYLARFTLLLGLRERYDVTPWQYLLMQLSGGRAIIGKLVDMLLPYSQKQRLDLHGLQRELEEDIADLNVRVAIDEAQVAVAHGSYPGESGHVRGMIRPLLGALYTWRNMKLALAGTQLGIYLAKDVVSSLNGVDPTIIANEFAPDMGLAESVLDRLAIDWRGLGINVEMMRGRPRFAMSVLLKLAEVEAEGVAERDLQAHVDHTIDVYRSKLAVQLSLRVGRTKSIVEKVLALYCDTIEHPGSAWLPVPVPTGLDDDAGEEDEDLQALYELLQTGVFYPSRRERGEWGYQLLESLPTQVLRGFLFNRKKMRSTATQALVDSLNRSTGEKGEWLETVVAQAFCDVEESTRLGEVFPKLEGEWADVELQPGRQLVSTTTSTDTLQFLDGSPTDPTEAVLMPDANCGSDIILVAQGGDGKPRIVSLGLKLRARNLEDVVAKQQETRTPPADWWLGNPAQETGIRNRKKGRDEWEMHELFNARA